MPAIITAGSGIKRAGLQALHTATKACMYTQLYSTRSSATGNCILHLSLLAAPRPECLSFTALLPPSNCAIVIASESVSIEWWKFQFCFLPKLVSYSCYRPDIKRFQKSPNTSSYVRRAGETTNGTWLGYNCRCYDTQNDKPLQTVVCLEPRPLSLLWLHAALIAPRSPLMGNCMIRQRVGKTALLEHIDISATSNFPTAGEIKRSSTRR